MSISAYHTKLSDLIIKFLKSVDSYNADDLAVNDSDTDQDTLGERARICINLALSTIYSLVKDSKYLEALPSDTQSSIANQDFIQLDLIPELDDVESVIDTTNDFPLTRQSWDWYRENYSDPSSQTGTPNSYIVRNDRIYLAPRPSSALPYLIDFKKLTHDLSLPGDLPLLPSQYDVWIIAEAKVWWYGMEDPMSVPPLVITERDRIQQASVDAIMTGYNISRVSKSHFDRSSEPRTYGYQRPVGG